MAKNYQIAHDVFAEELQQYPINSEKQLDEPGQHFVALSNENGLIGYVSINSPNDRKFRMEKYFGKEVLEEITLI